MFINLVWLAYILQIRTNQDTTQNAFSLDRFLFLIFSWLGGKHSRETKVGGISYLNFQQIFFPLKGSCYIRRAIWFLFLKDNKAFLSFILDNGN